MKADRSEVLRVRNAWRWPLFGGGAALLALAAHAGAAPMSPHVAIHAPERTFSAGDVRARLARSDSPSDRVLREILQNPEQLKTVLALMQRVRELAGDDFPWPESATLDERIAELAQRLSSDERLLAALQRDPELALLAARLAQSVPERLKNRLRDNGVDSTAPFPSLPPSETAAKRPNAPAPPADSRNRADDDQRPPSNTAAEHKRGPEGESGQQKNEENVSTTTPSRTVAKTPAKPSGSDFSPSEDKASAPLARSAAPKSAPPRTTSRTPTPTDSPRLVPRDPLTAGLIRASRNLERAGGPLKNSEALRRAIHRLETSTPPPPPAPPPPDNVAGSRTSAGTAGPGAEPGAASGGAQPGGAELGGAERRGSLVTSGLEQLTGGTEGLSAAARGAARNLRDAEARLGQLARDSRSRIWSVLPSIPKPPLPPLPPLPALPALPRPRLGNLDFSWSTVPGWTGRVPSLPTISARAMLPWLAGGVGFLAAALLARHVTAKRLVRPRTDSARPIPDASAIHDRQSLRQTVEHLALAAIGESARTDHHLKLAERLCQGAFPCSASSEPVANEFASVYERARYLPPAEALAPEELDRGRRLCVELAMKYRN